jgi:hypothetical protein
MVANDKYLYYGGSFPNVGPHRTRGLLRWDGKRWEDMTSGFANRILNGERYAVNIIAMALDSFGNLYVSGGFDTAGGVRANKIAKFDGTSWSDYSKDYPFKVHTPTLLATRSHDLIATAEELNGFVAINDGSGWKQLPPVRDFAAERKRVLMQRAKAKAEEEARRKQEAEARRNKKSDNDFVYADEIGVADGGWDNTGDRDELYDTEINPRIAIDELAVVGDDIYIASHFNRADSAILLKLAGEKWTPIPREGNYAFRFLYGYRDTLYVQGMWPLPPYQSTEMAWDGKSWTYLKADSGTSFHHVFHLNGRLMALGSPGDDRKQYGTFYEWTAGQWQRLKKIGMGGFQAESFANNSNTVFAKLYLPDTAYWRGSNLAQFTFNDKENSLTASELENEPALGLFHGASDIVKYKNVIAVAGNIYCAGSKEIDQVALWNDTSWRNLGYPIFRSKRQDYYSMRKLASDDRYLYVAGYASSDVRKGGNHVFRWDGVRWDSLSKTGFTSATTGLGDEANGSIQSLYVPKRGGIYAGGRFDKLENKPAGSIAYYDGKSWSAPDGGLDLVKKSEEDYRGRASVSSMIEHDGDLIVCGSFTHAGKKQRIATNNIARWDGKRWYAMGDGLTGYVNQVISHNGELFAGGEFYPNGVYSVPGYSLARWNGKSWDLELSMDSGMGRNFLQMFAIDSELYVARLEQANQGDNLYTWILKQKQGKWTGIDKILKGPSHFIVDGDKIYCNPKLFGGHRISQGFGIAKTAVFKDK